MKIPASPDGEVHPSCSGCMGPLSDAALKCKHCLSHMHLRCSGLPDHILVRHSVTQASYACAKCVKEKEFGNDNEKFEAELTKVKEIVAKEISIIEQVNREANTSIEVDHNDQVTQVDQNGGSSAIESDNQNNDNTGDLEANQRKKTESAICKYYLRRECQHGRVGKECRFQHPKICQMFSRNGDRRGGCKKGRNCRDFHPKVCHESMQNKECSRKKCRFFHLNATKLTFNESLVNAEPRNAPFPSPWQSNGPGAGLSYSQSTRTARTVPEFQNSNPYQGRLQVQDTDRNSNKQDFLMIEQRMQRLETMIASILQSVRPPPGPLRLQEQQ